MSIVTDAEDKAKLRTETVAPDLPTPSATAAAQGEQGTPGIPVQERYRSAYAPQQGGSIYGGSSTALPAPIKLEADQQAELTAYEGRHQMRDTAADLRTAFDASDWKRAALLNQEQPAYTYSYNAASNLAPVPGFDMWSPTPKDPFAMGAGLPPGLAAAGGLDPVRNVTSSMGGFNSATPQNSPATWDFGNAIRGVFGLAQAAEDNLYNTFRGIWGNRDRVLPPVNTQYTLNASDIPGIGSSAVPTLGASQLSSRLGQSPTGEVRVNARTINNPAPEQFSTATLSGLSQLAPTQGATNTERFNPAAGRFNEYGSGLLGAANYAIAAPSGILRAALADLKNNVAAASRGDVSVDWRNGGTINFLNTPTNDGIARQLQGQDFSFMQDRNLNRVGIVNEKGGALEQTAEYIGAFALDALTDVPVFGWAGRALRLASREARVARGASRAAMSALPPVERIGAQAAVEGLVGAVQNRQAQNAARRAAAQTVTEAGEATVLQPAAGSPFRNYQSPGQDGIERTANRIAPPISEGELLPDTSPAVDPWEGTVPDTLEGEVTSSSADLGAGQPQLPEGIYDGELMPDSPIGATSDLLDPPDVVDGEVVVQNLLPESRVINTSTANIEVLVRDFIRQDVVDNTTSAGAVARTEEVLSEVAPTPQTVEAVVDDISSNEVVQPVSGFTPEQQAKIDALKANRTVLDTRQANAEARISAAREALAQGTETGIREVQRTVTVEVVQEVFQDAVKRGDYTINADGALETPLVKLSDQRTPGMQMTSILDADTVVSPGVANPERVATLAAQYRQLGANPSPIPVYKTGLDTYEVPSSYADELAATNVLIAEGTFPARVMTVAYNSADEANAAAAVTKGLPTKLDEVVPVVTQDVIRPTSTPAGEALKVNEPVTTKPTVRRSNDDLTQVARFYGHHTDDTPLSATQLKALRKKYGALYSVLGEPLDTTALKTYNDTGLGRIEVQQENRLTETPQASKLLVTNKPPVDLSKRSVSAKFTRTELQSLTDEQIDTLLADTYSAAKGRKADGSRIESRLKNRDLLLKEQLTRNGIEPQPSPEAVVRAEQQAITVPEAEVEIALKESISDKALQNNYPDEMLGDTPQVKDAAREVAVQEYKVQATSDDLRHVNQQLVVVSQQLDATRKALKPFGAHMTAPNLDAGTYELGMLRTRVESVALKASKPINSADIRKFNAPEHYLGTRTNLHPNTDDLHLFSNSRNHLGVGALVTRNAGEAEQAAKAGVPSNSLSVDRATPTGRVHRVALAEGEYLSGSTPLSPALRKQYLGIAQRELPPEVYNSFKSSTMNEPLGRYLDKLTEASKGLTEDARFRFESEISKLFSDNGYLGINYIDEVLVFPQEAPALRITNTTEILGSDEPSAYLAASYNRALANHEKYGTKVTEAEMLVARSSWLKQEQHELKVVMEQVSREVDEASGRLVQANDKALRIADAERTNTKIQQVVDFFDDADATDEFYDELGDFNELECPFDL